MKSLLPFDIHKTTYQIHSHHNHLPFTMSKQYNLNILLNLFNHRDEIALQPHQELQCLLKTHKDVHFSVTREKVNKNLNLTTLIILFSNLNVPFFSYHPKQQFSKNFSDTKQRARIWVQSNSTKTIKTQIQNSNLTVSINRTEKEPNL